MVNPYDQYRDTRLWKVIEEAIEELVRNKDLLEQTPREYIVGYLCKRLREMGGASDASQD